MNYTMEWLIFALWFLSTMALVPLVKDKDQMKQALKRTVANILSAVLFGGYIAFERNSHDAYLYLTGFVVEKALSLDNLFVIQIIFSALLLDIAMQRRLLQFGIIGAMVLRGIFILLGAVTVAKFAWVLSLLGIGLLILGGKILQTQIAWLIARLGISSVLLELLVMLVKQWPQLKPWAQRQLIRSFASQIELEEEPWALRTARQFGWSVFWLALFAVEVTDIIFAIDSVPAILGITQDFFLVFTSNMFAIAGLRSFYFYLESLREYEYLEPTLGGILCFIGVKTLLPAICGIHISPFVSLVVVVSAIALAIIFSPKEAEEDEAPALAPAV